MRADRSQSFYLFDIDDNLLFLPTKIYVRNAETNERKELSSGAFADIQNALGRPGPWQSWSVFSDTFKDFRDDPKLPPEKQTFFRDLISAIEGGGTWQGPAWPLLAHAARNKRAIALVTARGHASTTIHAGLQELARRGLIVDVPPILGIYGVSNPDVRRSLGATDPDITIPSVKKLAIKDAVEKALARFGDEYPHRFGMSDDDPNNVVLAISAMRDCKLAHPDKRFFVINTNHTEYVKLEIFPMRHPVTSHGTGGPVLSDAPRDQRAICSGGNTSIYVTDMDRAIRFYTDLLGLAFRRPPTADWVELDAGKGMVIGLHRARPPATVTAGTMGAINIELAAAQALDTVVADLKRKGVVFRGPTQDYPEVRIATLLDPDRNEILLTQVLDG